MLIALNTHFRRRRRLNLLLVTMLLCFAVVTAHGAVAGAHMTPGLSGHAMVLPGTTCPKAR